MLETWDAAVGFSSSRDETRGHPVDIANLLGWTQDRSYRDAAINYSTRGRVENVQPIELTRLLGWTPKRTLGA